MTTNTTASQAILRAVADALQKAEASRTPIAPISSTHPELTVADAYAIQSINAQSRVADAANPTTIVGHKIGLTAKAMQEMLGVDEPDYGCLYADRVLEDGAQIAAAELIAPRVEPEIAFVLAEPLAGPGVTAQDVLAATAYVVPALEVIDSRIADWKIGLVDTIADNASCACVVLGTTRTAPSDVDLAAAAVDLRVNQVGSREKGRVSDLQVGSRQVGDREKNEVSDLEKGRVSDLQVGSREKGRVSDLGESVQQGTGAAVLGHPAEAVAWLANALAGHGVTLEAGQVLMPGSLTAAVPFVAGDHVVADFGPLGTVEVRCS